MTNKILITNLYHVIETQVIIIKFFNKRRYSLSFFFFLKDTPPPEIYTLPLHAALPISRAIYAQRRSRRGPEGPRLDPSRARGARQRRQRARIRIRLERVFAAGDQFHRSGSRRYAGGQIGRAHAWTPVPL